MSAPTTAQVGERTELARYRVADEDRVVYGQRIHGVVRLTDRPADDHGRAFLIERGLNSMDELTALVADYVDQAQRLKAPPLSRAALNRLLGVER